MSHPIPCAHCGVNFMRHNLSPDYPKICNSCMLKEKQHKKGNVENMNMVKLLVEVDRQTQVEIEEICINEGISLSLYFLMLHQESKAKKSAQNSDRQDDPVEHSDLKEPEKGNQKKGKANKR